MENNTKIKNIVMGPLQIIFSSLCFAFMSYYGKIATAHLPGPEVTFFRLAFGSLVVLGMALSGSVKLVTENIKLLMFRGFLGGAGVLLFFIALEKGTVTNSVVLQNTYPIFAALLSIYILKEKISLKTVIFMLVTFVGIIILIRPDVDHLRVGDLLALAAGFLGGFAVTAIRQLRKKDESVWTIFFHFCLFGAIISLVIALPYWKWPQSGEYLWLFLTAFLGLIGQVAMTSALKYCNAVVGGILSMSTCVFSFIIGIVLLHEKVGILDFIGIFLIIAGNVMVVAFEESKPKPASQWRQVKA